MTVTNYNAIRNNIANPPYGSPRQILENATSNGEQGIVTIGERRPYNLYVYGDFDGAEVIPAWSVNDGIDFYQFLNENGIPLVFTKTQIQYFRLLDTNIQLLLQLSNVGASTNINAELR